MEKMKRTKKLTVRGERAFFSMFLLFFSTIPPWPSSNNIPLVLNVFFPALVSVPKKSHVNDVFLPNPSFFRV